MDPGEAIRGFLHALGLPPQRIPTGLDAQVASYRSALAGRQVLVVLDNARDAEQVRPLLPGAPGSMAVVTSRDRLTSLVAAEGGTGHRGRRTFGIFRLGPAQRTGQLAVRLPQQLVLRVDLWQVGDRGIVVEVGQEDKELPLQLMLVVGDLSSDPGTS